MTTTLKAKFDGKVLVPEGVVDLPIGEVLTFRREELVAPPKAEYRPLPGEKTGLQRLAEAAELHGDVDLPSDFSAQHDHYLYGTPKREDA